MSQPYSDEIYFNLIENQLYEKSRNENYLRKYSCTN